MNLDLDSTQRISVRDFWGIFQFRNYKQNPKIIIEELGCTMTLDKHFDNYPYQFLRCENRIQSKMPNQESSQTQNSSRKSFSLFLLW